MRQRSQYWLIAHECTIESKLETLIDRREREASDMTDALNGRLRASCNALAPTKQQLYLSTMYRYRRDAQRRQRERAERRH